MQRKNLTSDNNNAIYLLVELRSRLLYSLLVLFSLFGILSFFANDLYTLLAQPLLKFLPQGHLIATQIVSPFFVPFKLAFMTAIFLSIPYFLYQGWSFIAPALYGHERRMIWPFLLLSAVLFYLGMAFAYFIIFPTLFSFLAHMMPEGVALSPDIGEYFDLTTKLLLMFGALFEIPIVMVVLVAIGLVSRETFRKKRSYAFLGAFIIGMLLAPPDVLSMTLLAIPIWLLYEVGILLSCLVKERVQEIKQES